ncbi:MAG TPA: class I SAM-dependent methyltransferase, partial [Chitinophagaceae bacterium]
MPDTLPHDSITPFGHPKKTKKEQVEEMFNSIAGKYDKVNHILSAGIDRAWRKKAILQLQADKPERILDVATGTGDMAIMAQRVLNPQKVIGIDISDQMLELGRKKIEKEGLNS